MSGQPPPSTTSKVPTQRFSSERMGLQGATASQVAQFMRAKAAGYQPPPQGSPVASTGSSAGSSAGTSSPTATAATSMSPDEQVARKYITELDNRACIPAPKPQTINLEKFKGHKFVTADGLINTTRALYDEISGTFQWEIWETQTDSCMKFIKEKCADRRVFLVVSGAIGKEFVPLIHQLPQVYAIYIFCGTVQFHLGWSREYEKVHVVCDDDDRYLLPQLAVDVARSNMDWGDALLKRGDQDARVLAKTKFEKAKKNLTDYAKKPDRTMINEVDQKLKQCA